MTVPVISLSDVAPEAKAPARPSTWLVALRSFANGAMVAAIIVCALLGLELDFGLPRLVGAAVMGFLGFAIVFAGEGIAILLWKVLGGLFRLLHFGRGVQLLQTVPAVPIGRIFGVFIFIAGDTLWPDSFFQHITLPVVGEMAILLTGVTVMMIALARLDGRSRPARFLLVGIPTILILAFAVWIINPGFDRYLNNLPDTAVAPTLALENPGQPGPYAVQTLTYGSGDNTRRPEFGETADLITPVVDGSPIFSGYDGLTGSYFQWFWGFDFRQLPLNGTVWYPEGAGPFPLVLIVHGNHPMSDYSDPGYAYLGEHLASQGYVAASIDENFLNGLAFFDGEFEEMPLRAWLLLQHLQQWQSWNETAGNPFNGKVDMDNIALIGHSRGGEAVAWAEYLNWREMEPVTAVSSPDEFGFGIRGVVSIAPSDAYAGPGGRKPTLDHTNYLLLAGGHDSDTFLLYGQRQYNRMRFNDNPEGFKALAYVHQANHGQFNTIWGIQDRGLYNSRLLNTAPLLTADEQQQAAKVLITSFLNAALKNENGYRNLFRNPAAANWLPDSIIATQFQEAPFIRVDTNSGSGQLAATEVTGAEAAAQDMTLAKVKGLTLRDGQTYQDNKVLQLAWDANSQPMYEITLPEEKGAAWGLSPANALTFALARVPGVLLTGEIMVELDTAVGETTRLPLSDFAPLPASLPAHLVKADWLYGLNGFPDDIIPEEVVLQTYTLPLAAFQTANPDFQPDQLRTIRFLFDGREAGAVYLDEIGFSPGQTAVPTTPPITESDLGFDCTAVTEIPTAECQALVAFYEAANGPAWVEQTGWLQTNTPCSWLGVTCVSGHVDTLGLYFNNLQGKLSPALANLSQLRVLDLHNNTLNGEIPAALGQLAALEAIDLSANQLSGAIPAAIGALPKLQFLQLPHNRLRGTIPDSFAPTGTLRILDLSHNQLSGAIPIALADLPTLESARLSNNQLSGAIPASFGAYPALSELDLAFNQLSGAVDAGIPWLPQQRLWGNQLDGTIFTAASPQEAAYEGVRFAYDPALADSVWPEQRPALPPMPGPGGMWSPGEHLLFTLVQTEPQNHAPMGLYVPAEAQIHIYPVAGLNAEVQPVVDKLTQILDNRPDLAAHETVDLTADSAVTDLPMLPVTNARQTIRAQAEYVNFDNGRGLRYLTHLSQGPGSINNQELFYTFQGLTDDGATYVAIYFPVTLPGLPDSAQMSDAQFAAIMEDWSGYLGQTAATLDEQPASAFSPDLSLLDALAASLHIETSR